MTKLTTIILAISLFFACNKQKSETPLGLKNSMDSLIQCKSFFKLKSLYDNNNEQFIVQDKLYYGALIDLFFNNAASSNQKIVDLLAATKEPLNDSLLFEIYKAKRMNHINLYEYAEAVEASQFILAHYKNIADSADFAEYESLVLNVANSSAQQEKLQLHIDDVSDEKTLIHGNFGQDYIKKFNKMIVSFKYSAVVFE